MQSITTPAGNNVVMLMVIRGENTKYVDGEGAEQGAVIHPAMLRSEGDDIVGFARTCYGMAVPFRMPLDAFCELELEQAVA